MCKTILITPTDSGQDDLKNYYHYYERINVYKRLNLCTVRYSRYYWRNLTAQFNQMVYLNVGLILKVKCIARLAN